MPTRRPHARLRATAQAVPPQSWSVNSRSITFIATWRGQLLVCTVAVVLGAIYFVLREPIGRWRRRQRERLSRVRQEELLSMDKGKLSAAAEDRATGPSSGNSSSVASSGSKTARERGREKRKEKKRERVGHACPSETTHVAPSALSAPSISSLDSSPNMMPTAATADSADPQPSLLELDTGAATSNPSAPSRPTIISLESSASESPPETTSTSHFPPESSISHHRTLSVPTLSIDTGPGTTFDLDSPRASASASRSPSYSMAADDLSLPASTGRKKKRRSKGRSGNDARGNLGIGPSLSMARNVTVSSDDTPSQSSPTMSAPGSPRTPRRRREASLGGMQLSPALEILLNNNERTIDSLRAEIGHAKAEESKAREDESRARDDLRRARAAEDRMRHDYERSRKARDRAEIDSRRLEAEVLHIRSRFDTLAHMYHAVCTRLREVEMNTEHQHPHQPPPHSPHLGTPGMGYPSPVTSTMGYFPHHAQGLYPSPMQPHGFANFVLSPSPHRRSDGGGMGADVLAGPLTPGLGGPETASTSQVSSPYPSDMSHMPMPETPASSAAGTSDGQLSTAELRRLNIASSVLKKKKTAGESENGDSTSSPDSRPLSLGRDAKEIVEGLGIRTVSGVQSTFQSVNGVVGPKPVQPTKQGSTSSTSSDVSSAPTGRLVPITPSDSGPFRHAQSPAPLSSPGLKDNDGFAADSHTDSHALDPPPTKPTLNDSNDPHDPQSDAIAEAEETDYVPLFASLAHTPEQLAEIARIRQDAIRDRERRSRSRACSASDTL